MVSQNLFQRDALTSCNIKQLRHNPEYQAINELTQSQTLRYHGSADGLAASEAAKACANELEATLEIALGI